MVNYQILIVAAVCLAMGFLIGLIVSSLRGEPPASETPQTKQVIPNLQAEQRSPTTHTVVSTSSHPPASNIIPKKHSPSALPEEPPLTMIEQINQILQDELAHSPLKGVYIKLLELPEGIVVWVDNQSYAGVDAVPEGEAKELIRMAVNKWERR